MAVSFTIKCPPNLSNQRGHWSVRARIGKEVRREVWAVLHETKQHPTAHDQYTLAKEPVKKLVTFTRYFGGRTREMDWDGVASATKPVLDALKLGDKGVGLIYDDAPKWCAVTWDQKKDKDKAGTLEVTVQ